MVKSRLKDLMTEAADGLAYTPDLDALLRTGRRQVRTRRLLTSVATVAAMSVITGATTVAASR